MRALQSPSVRRFFMIAALLAAFSPSAHAQFTCTAAATGNWNVAGTWSGCGGGVPDSDDAVIIQGPAFGAGYTVTVSAAAAAASVDIRPGTVGQTNALTNNASLTVTGDITFSTPFSGTNTFSAMNSSTTSAANLSIASTASTTSQLVIETGSVSVGNVSFVGGVPSTAIIEFTNTSGSLNVSGNFGGGGTVTNTVDGLVQFVGTGLQTVVGRTFGRVVVNNPVGVDMGSGIPAINGLLTIASGDLDIGSNSFSIGGTLDVDGTFTGTGTTVTLSGAGATIDGTGSFNGVGLVLPTSKTILATAALTGIDSIALSAGADVTNNGSIAILGNISASALGSIWTNASGSSLAIGGNLFFGSNGVFDGSASSNTVTFNSTSGFQTVGGESSALFFDVMVSTGAFSGVAFDVTTTINDDLTVATGAQLVDNGNQITGNGTGTLTLDASSTLQIGDSTGTTTMPSFAVYTFDPTSTVIYDADGAQTITPVPTYGNLKTGLGSGVCKGRPAQRARGARIGPLVSATKTISPAGTLRVLGDFHVNLSSCDIDLFDAGLNSIDVDGSVLGDSNFQFGVGGSPTLNVGGDFTLTFASFTAGDSTVIYDGTTQVVGGFTYNNLTIANAGFGTATLNAPATVNGTLEVTNSSILDDGGQQISGNAAGFLFLRANSQLHLGSGLSATTFPTSYVAGNITIEPGAIVHYNAEGAQLVSTVPTYQGLTLTTGATASTKTLSPAATLNATDLYLIDGTAPVTFDAGGNDVILANSLHGDGDFTSTADLTIGGSYLNTGTFTTSPGTTQTYNGTGGPFTLRGGISYQSLVIATGGTYNSSAPITAVTFNIAAGSLLSWAADGLTVSGNLTVDGDVSGSAALDMSTAAAFDGTGTIDAPLNLSGIGTYSLLPTSNLTIASANDLSLGGMTAVDNSGAITITGDLVGTGADSWNNLAASTLQVDGALFSGGALLTATANPNTVIYGGAAQTVLATTYHHLTLDGSGSKTIAGALSVNGDFSVLGSASTAPGGALTIGGSVGVNGGTLDLGTFTHQVGGSWDSSLGTVIVGTSTVDFTGATASSIIGDFNNLTISGTDKTIAGTVNVDGDVTITAPGELNAGGGTLTLFGDWNNSGSYVSGPGLIRFAGSVTQGINGGSTSFSNLEVDNGANVQQLSGTGNAVTGTLTLTNGHLELLGIPFTLGPAVTIVEGSGKIIGTVTQQLAVGPTYLIPVGTSTGYAPVSVTATAIGGPASIDVTNTQGPHPSASGGSNVLQRYWTLSPTNLTSANLLFQYQDVDVVGTETSYVIAKHDGTSWSYPGGSINTATNQATINGVTSFSDWTLGESASLVGPCTVTNTLDSGAGSLRQAVTDANAGTCGASPSIAFNIPTSDSGFASGVFTIKPTTGGYTLRIDGMILDGATQTSFSGDTNASGPEVVLDFSLAGATTGLAIETIAAGQGNGLQIRNLAIINVNGDGIILNGIAVPVQNSVIAGNYIGIDPTGNFAASNGSAGILTLGNVSNNTIGGAVATDRNILSGNAVGISLSGSATNNVLYGNFIGTDAAGTGGVPNTISGIELGASAVDNTIGAVGAGLGNTIAFNGQQGIVVSGGTGNEIRGNSIHSNGALGIDLGADGVTADDPGDGDTGANNLQNAPVLISATLSGPNTLVSGTIDTNSSTTVNIDLYTNLVPDATGHGEGEVYLGSQSVATGVGPTPFTITVPGDVRAGYLTATATRVISPLDTSEFSLVLDADLSIAKVDSADPVNAGSSYTYTITVTNNGPSTADELTVTDTLPAGVGFVSAVGTGWVCNESAGVVTCTIGTLAASTSSNIVITLTAPAAGGTITNNADVAAVTPDQNTANNSIAENTAITAIADLSISKTDSADPVNAGAAFSYSLTVNNVGPSAATSVSVSDTLPAGVGFVSASGTGWICNESAGVVTCTMASFSVGSSLITINVTAPAAGGTITNNASVSASSSDPNGANNSATQNTTVTAVADLSIAKTDSADPVNANAAFSYTLTINNAGPSVATSLSVSDTLPAGVGFVSASGAGWTCNESAGVVTCTAASLAVGSSVITINVTAPATAGTVTNNASVSATTSDPNGANNSASQNTTVSAVADLSITKTDSADPVNAGAALSYSLTVGNAGPSTATSVSVSDTLPAGVTFVSASGTGWICNESAGVVTCTIASLGVGGSVITINVTAPASGGTITNNASVSATTSDPNGANNSASQNTTVTAVADLSISKTDSADPVNASAAFSYTLTINNAGPSTATSLSVSDTLPAGVTFVSASGAGWICNESAGVVTCTAASLAVGSSVITINVTAPATAGTITNNASVSSATSDPNGANNSASQNTTVTAVADLSISKTDSVDPVNASAAFSYTLTINNAGPSAATSVSVSDTLPAGVGFVSASGTGWICNESAGVVTCTTASLAVGSSVITINVTAPANGGTITNNASVGATTSDPNGANNSASQNTTVTAVADLSIAKTDSADPVNANAAFSYTVTVSNAGPSTATSLTVTDTLPAGVGFVSASGAGWICNQSAGVVTCTTASLSVGSSVITINVTAPAAGGTITNNVSVSATSSDSNGANNSASQATTVNAIAALTLTKSDSADPVNAGAAFSYILQVDNAGPSTATNVTITDTLPGGVTYAGFSGAGWSCVGTTTITCTLASLASGASSTVTLNVTAPTAGGSISNNASVTSTEGSTAPGSETTTITANANLSITKTDSADPVNANAPFSYTLTVTNAGPSTATNVTVTDTLPAGVTFVSASGTGWTCSGTTTVTCTMASFPVGTKTITINVTAPSTGGPVTNTASVSATTSDPNGANNSGSQTTTVTAVADLAISKTDSADPVLVGSPLSYTLTVNNIGPSTATGVAVVDTLPAGVSFVSATGTGWSCSGTTTITCTRASLAVGSSTITINVTAPNTAGPITNTVTVGASTNDPTSANNNASQTTTITAAGDDVGILKSGPAEANVGSTLVYTITVKNLGSGIATNVVVTDPTPAGLQFISNSGDCTTAFPCSFASIPVASQKTITSTYLVTAAAPLTVTNTASVTSSSPDGNSANNSASATTTICSGFIGFTNPADGATDVPTSGTLSWNTTGADLYRVFLAAGDAGCTTLFGTTETPSIAYSDLMPGARYTWKIVSVRGGCEVAGPCNSFTTAGQTCANGAPIALSPENGETQVVPPVTFTWSSVVGATGYKVFAVIGDDEPTLLGETVGENSTSLTADVPFGATIAWYVEAHFAACPPTTSARNTFTSASSEVCDFGAPRLISPANGSQNLNSPLNVDWDGVPGAVGYRVWVGVGDSFPVILASTTTETSATVRVPAGTLKLFVQALFNGCPPTISDVHEIGVLRRADCPTAIPELVLPVDGATFAPEADIEFDWTDVPNSIGYALWMSIDGDAPSIYGKTDETTSRFVRSVPSGDIEWYIEVFYEACDSTFTAHRRFTVLDAIPCENEAPQLTNPATGAENVSSLVEFQWNAVENADEYRVYVKVNGTEPQHIGTTTAETSLLAPVSGAAIEAYVEALFDGCPSTESQHINFTLATAPNCNNSAPSLLLPGQGSTQSTTEVTLVWTSVANAVGYEIYSAHNEGAPTLLEIVPAGQTSLTLTLPEGRHAWRVDALFNGCSRTSSPEAFFTIALPPQCDVEAALLLSPEDGLANLTSPVEFSWNEAVGAVGYRVMISMDGGTPDQLGSTTTATQLTATVPTGELAWWVESIPPGGCDPIASLPRMIRVIPQPPCDLPEKTEGRSVETISPEEVFVVSWDPRPGATIYEVERKVFRNGGLVDTSVDVVQGTSKTYQAGPAAPEEQQFRIRAIGDCNQERGPYSDGVIVLVRDPIHITLPPPGSGLGVNEGLDFNLDRFSNATGEGGTTFIATQRAFLTVAGATGPVTVSISADQPWLTFEPNPVTIQPSGTFITLRIDYAQLPVGASNATITFSYAAKTGAFNGGTVSAPSSVSLSTPVTATPGTQPPPNSIIVPAVAHADGSNSKWISDIRLTNVTPSVIRYQLNFTPSGTDGTKVGKQTTLEVPPGRTLALNDILKTSFDGGEIGQGVLEIRPMNVTPTSFTSVVSSRTYNQSANGTFGQFIPGIPFSKFVGLGTPAKPTTLSIQQIAQSTEFRTNFGFVEASGKPVNALMSVFSASGQKVGEIPISLKAGEQRQFNSLLAANNISLQDGRVEVKVTSGEGRVSAYASVIDNRTGDPLVVPAVQLSTLNAAKYVVPGVADLRSAGTNWRTDMRLLNASSTPQVATLVFYPQNNPAQSITKNVTIQPGEVSVLDNILSSTFGVTNIGGAVHVSTADPTALVATARTYDNQTDGTFGQFVPAISANEATGLGLRPLQILQLEESNQFRANLGVAEVTGKAATIEITAIVPDSTVSPKKTIQLQPNEFKQITQIMKDLGLGTVYNGRISIKVINGSGKVTAYGSIIDNKTQDPTYVPAQ